MYRTRERITEKENDHLLICSNYNLLRESIRMHGVIRLERECNFIEFDSMERRAREGESEREAVRNGKTKHLFAHNQSARVATVDRERNRRPTFDVIASGSGRRRRHGDRKSRKTAVQCINLHADKWEFETKSSRSGVSVCASAGECNAHFRFFFVSLRFDVIYIDWCRS